MRKDVNVIKSEQELLFDIESNKGKTRKKILLSMYNKYIELSESDEYSKEFKSGYFASIRSLVKVCHEAKIIKDFNEALNYRVNDKY